MFTRPVIPLFLGSLKGIKSVPEEEAVETRKKIYCSGIVRKKMPRRRKAKIRKTGKEKQVSLRRPCQATCRSMPIIDFSHFVLTLPQKSFLNI